MLLIRLLSRSGIKCICQGATWRRGEALGPLQAPLKQGKHTIQVEGQLQGMFPPYILFVASDLLVDL